MPRPCVWALGQHSSRTSSPGDVSQKQLPNFSLSCVSLFPSPTRSIYPRWGSYGSVCACSLNLYHSSSLVTNSHGLNFCLRWEHCWILFLFLSFSPPPLVGISFHSRLDRVGQLPPVHSTSKRASLHIPAEWEVGKSSSDLSRGFPECKVGMAGDMWREGKLALNSVAWPPFQRVKWCLSPAQEIGSTQQAKSGNWNCDGCFPFGGFCYCCPHRYRLKANSEDCVCLYVWERVSMCERSRLAGSPVSHLWSLLVWSHFLKFFLTHLYTALSTLEELRLLLSYLNIQYSVCASSTEAEQ